MKRFLTTLLILTTVLVPACQPLPENRLGFEPEEAELLLAICLDRSGSFEQEMIGTDGHEGKAYRTFLAVRDRFFRDRQQSKDRLILSQICGSEKAILLDAEPKSFHERFPDAAAFRTFLQSQPDPGGSRVYLSLRDTVDYLTLQHRNASKLKSMALIFTDMEDNVGDSAQSKQLLTDSLKAYAKAGGLVGIYGCELSTVPEWSRVLQQCGFRDFVVESGIRENPKLPVLD